MTYLIKIAAKIITLIWLLLTLIVAIAVISRLFNSKVKGISNTDIYDYLKISALLISVFIVLKLIYKKMNTK